MEYRLMLAGLVGLWAILVASVLLPAQTQMLNRSPHERPDFRLTGWGAEAYRQSWSDYLADKLVLAMPARGVNALIEIRVFGDPSSELVVTGRQGWLFYAPAFSMRPVTADRQAQAARSARLMLDRLSAHGVDAYFMPAPHKASQIRDHLPEHLLDAAAAGDAAREALMTGLQSDERVVDVFDAMAAAQQVHPVEALYFPQDTHWTPLGASIAARGLINALSEGLWDDAALQLADETNDFQPDLLRMQNLSAQVGMPNWRVARLGTAVISEIEQPGAYLSRVDYVSSGPDVRLPPAVLIGDSYSGALAPLLAPYFERLTIVRLHPGMDSTELGSILREDFAIALVVLVERSLWQDAPTGLIGFEDLIPDIPGDGSQTPG